MPIYLAVGIVIFLIWLFAVRAAKRHGSLVNKAQVTSRAKRTNNIARAFSYLFLGGFIAVMAFTLFIYLPREYARTNVMRAVPSSIKP